MSRRVPGPLAPAWSLPSCRRKRARRTAGDACGAIGERRPRRRAAPRPLGGCSGAWGFAGGGRTRNSPSPLPDPLATRSQRDRSERALTGRHRSRSVGRNGPEVRERAKKSLGTGSAPRVIRIPDLLIRSQTLYPTELWARGEERLVLAGVSAVNSVPQRRRGGQLTEFSPIRGSQRASRPLPSHVETLTSPLACRDAPKSPLQPPGGRGATLPSAAARRWLRRASRAGGDASDPQGTPRFASSPQSKVRCEQGLAPDRRAPLSRRRRNARRRVGA